MQRSLFDFIGNKTTASGPTASPIDTVVDVDGESDQALTPATAPRNRTRSRSPSPPLRATKAAKLSSPRCSCEWLPSLIVDPEWRDLLAPFMADDWRGGQFRKIEQFLDSEAAAGKTILPPRADIFSALNSSPLHKTKVVLLGQDPYHGIGQAHGLCFSVRPGVRVPPSLQNVYKELVTDIPGFTPPGHGYLQSWAEQGVLMLNASLTVEAHKANSHAAYGWQLFTDDVVAALSSPQQSRRLVFLLWGNFAKKKKRLIDLSRHVVIETAHPSPLSAKAWFSCKCFSKCNAELQQLGHTPIDWTLPPLPHAR